MTHWRTSRETVGGNQLPGSPLGSYAPANSILLPADPPLERGELAQALIDILALGALSLPVSSFCFSFGCNTLAVGAASSCHVSLLSLSACLMSV